MKKKILFMSSAKLTALSIGLLLAVFCTIGMSFTPAEEGDNVGNPNDSTYVSGPRHAHASGGKCGSDTKSNDYGRGIAYTKGGGKVIVEDATKSAETSVIDKYGYKSGIANEVNPTEATYSGTDDGNYSYVQWRCNETKTTNGTANAHQRTLKWTADPNDGYKFDGWSTTESGDIDPSLTNPYTYTMTMADGTYNSTTGYADTDKGRLSTRLYAHFSEKVVATVTMPQTEHGSYTYSCVDGNGTVNTTTPGSVITAEEITFVATAASGYKFFGWYTLDGTEEEYLSLSATYKKAFSANTTIYAKFIPTNAATFVLKGTSQYYTDLGAAISAAIIATGNAKVIVPTSNGTVSAGNYTIPNGVTLLLPYDDAYTVKTTDPSHTLAAPGTPSVYRKLTLASGVNITVQNGAAISVSAISQGGQPYGGCVYGKYGQVDMNTGSSITLNSGANLYCWGYITGGGEITAESGSTIYEDFQIACWRGGNAAAGMNNNKQKVFPLAQYYIQNIEAKLHMQSGATEYVWTAVTANSAVQRPNSIITLIGKTSGLFQINSGTLTKWYNASTDRQMYELNGNATIGSVSMRIYVTISSSNYVLPLTNNMDITIKSGTMSCDNDIALLPGASITIAKGANASLGSNCRFYIYDKAEWPEKTTGFNYPNNVAFCKVNYTATKITTARTYANMADALLDINGTLTTASGAIYTTDGGANITSSEGTGKLVFSNKAGTETVTYQAIQESNYIKEYVPIPVTPAQLHNASQWYTAPYTGDNACEYLATAGAAANTTITYAHGHWGWIGIWKDHDGTILKVANTCLESQLEAKAPTPNPTRPDEGCTIYTFNSWSSNRNETNQEIVYTATYDESTRTYSIAYEAGADGTGTVEGGTKTCGVDFVLSSRTFTRTGYTQTGWSTTDGGTKAYDLGGTYTADAAITLYPFWSPNTNTAYTVKHFLQNIDGTCPSEPEETDNLTGTTGASVTPAVKSYTGFTAPDTQTATISADGSLVITYQYTRNSYTLTWDANGGKLSGDYTTGPVKYGAPITPPTAIRDGYDFTGWDETPAATMPAEAKTYTAQWTVAEAGFYVDIVDVDNTAKTLTLNVTGWASSGWPYTVNSTSYEKTARQTDRTLIIPYTGNVGESMTITVQKTGGDIVSKHNYIVPAAITSDAALGDQQMIFVKPNTTLTVDADKTIKNIYVAPGAKLVVNAGVTLKADTVFLRTTPWLSAELELNGSISGQVCYTRIICKKDAYYQFGLPMSCPIASVRLSDGTTPVYGNGWLLRSYSEASRAQNGTGADIDNWVTLTSTGSDDAEIQGCVGYEMFSNSGYYREYYFPVAHTDLASSVAVTHTTENTKGAAHEGWNIVCSPLMRTYTQSPAPEGLVFSWLQEDGSYIQQPVEEVKPAIPFSYQAKDNGNISFGATMAAPAPRRVAASEEQTRIQWIQLDVTDAKGESDHAGIYSHPTRYEDTYKAGIDVAKQSLTASRAIFYSSHAYGEMAFAGVSDSLLESGIALTVYSPAEQKLTLSMRENEWLNRMEYVWLIDNETGARTDLLWNDYSFRASESTTSGRFVILGRFFAPQITTDMEPVSDSSSNGAKARKVLMGQKMYIIVGEQIYDGTGKLVNKQ